MSCDVVHCCLGSTSLDASGLLLTGLAKFHSLVTEAGHMCCQQAEATDELQRPSLINASPCLPCHTKVCRLLQALDALSLWPIL